ncbi:hypothetical protein P3X46_026766 [Hevea brasiliensis]|uniref:Uncharacterized protein n=1 Tax=Hevea brasiliensis TaxID=3981 RepID=A0ABQ9KYN8_HEVBR|nr:hypothetical protein P3X46_026766 [Hevea brasiliensis]
MKERQRWRAEEDAFLRAYVKQYGPREWNLVSQRMNTPLNRDAKSCQYLVIRLQVKHGNKWKKIAAEVPGRTAKRLGKWWEPFKERQQRKQEILETFAEKLVKERPVPAFVMATSNGGFLHTGPPASAPNLLPPWLSTSNTISAVYVRPPSPSVTTSLSSLTCCRELEEEHRAWAASMKEAAWRLRRVELQLESKKPSQRKEKMKEIESKIKALGEEQKVSLDIIEAEYEEQLAELKRDAEAKEQKLVEQRAAKHVSFPVS